MNIKRIINFPTRGIGKATLAKIFANDTESLPAKTIIKINNFYNILDSIKEKISTEKASNIIKFTVKASGIESALLSGTEEEVEKLENIKEYHYKQYSHFKSARDKNRNKSKSLRLSE